MTRALTACIYVPDPEPMTQNPPKLAATAESQKSTRNQRLWVFFKTYRTWFLFGAFFLLATNAMNLAIPAYIGEAVETLRDAAAQGEGLGAGFDAVRDQLVNIGLIIVALAIGGGIRSEEHTSELQSRPHL